MRKTEIIHIRVTPEVKKQCEEIFNDLGVNTSYAVSMFFKQVIKKNGFPFELVNKSKDESEREIKICEAINATGGANLDPKLKKIVRLYIKGDIDYETAKFAINKEF